MINSIEAAGEYLKRNSKNVVRGAVAASVLTGMSVAMDGSAPSSVEAAKTTDNEVVSVFNPNIMPRVGYAASSVAKCLTEIQARVIRDASSFRDTVAGLKYRFTSASGAQKTLEVTADIPAGDPRTYWTNTRDVQTKQVGPVLEGRSVSERSCNPKDDCPETTILIDQVGDDNEPLLNTEGKPNTLTVNNIECPDNEICEWIVTIRNREQRIVIPTPFIPTATPTEVVLPPTATPAIPPCVPVGQALDRC